MKVAVINYSGNVGKSTVAGHLLKPKLNGERKRTDWTLKP